MVRFVHWDGLNPAVIPPEIISELIDFQRRFNKIKVRYEKNPYLWSASLFSLTPSSFALFFLIFAPAFLLLVLLGKFQAAVCLVFLLIFEYLLGYFPYYKEMPTYKKIKRHYTFFVAQREIYEKYLEHGGCLAQKTGLSFSGKGFFYTPDKQYRLQVFNGKFVKYYE